MKWYKTLSESGTLKDKIMALSLIVKNDPGSSLEYVRSLMKMANKKDRKQAFIAVDSLQELFTKHLLPENRKLKPFKQAIAEAEASKTPLTDGKLTEIYHEHMLRSVYIEYVDMLSAYCNDQLDYFKKLAISIISDCLMERPEREETLLSLLINKLGDPNNEIAKHTIQNVLRILKKHNNMTAVVTGEIQQYLERVKTPALYFYISLLNKIVFFEDDIDYITNVLKIYFSQFKRLSKEREESHKNEILTLILRGINNIASNLDPSTLETTYHSITDDLKLLFALTSSNSYKVKIESLKLIFQFIKVEEALSDKFYKTLYKVVGSLTSVSALKLDSTFALLYKAVKRDKCTERVIAFFKRLLQMCYVNEISFVAASLLFINEVLKHKKQLRGLLFSKEKLLDSDDEEVFVDVDQDKKKRKKKDKQKKKEQKKDEEKAEDNNATGLYDPSKKDPRYANADKTAFWEMDILRHYYHPTIRIWVRNLMTGQEIDYAGDPLQDFSMANFLDKIILKPAKSAEKLGKLKHKKRHARAEEIKENVKNLSTDDSLATLKSKIAKSGEYRPDEEFLYKHLMLKTQTKPKTKKAKKTDEEENDEPHIGGYDKEVEDFHMSDEEDLPSDFFGDEDGLEDVQVEDDHIDSKVFQEAPDSDLDDE